MATVVQGDALIASQKRTLLLGPNSGHFYFGPTGGLVTLDRARTDLLRLPFFLNEFRSRQGRPGEPSGAPWKETIHVPVHDLTAVPDLAIPPVLPDASRKISHSATECTIDYRDFLLPIRWKVDRRDEVKTIIWHVSRDQGGSWQKAGEIAPDDRGLPFHAKEDGSYWFTLQLLAKDGTRTPAEAGQEAAHVMKIQVDTRGRRTSAKLPDPAAYKMPYAN